MLGSNYSEPPPKHVTEKKDDKSSWATGGGLILGLGVGFFLLERSALYFVGSILVGIGIGLMVSALIAKK